METGRHHLPKQSDTSLGGGSHGAIIIDGVLSRDVVLQEQPLWVLLLQSVPLSCILEEKKKSNSNDFFPLQHIAPMYFEYTHPLRVKVFLDWEAVNNTGAAQTALHTVQNDQQQGEFGGFHPVSTTGRKKYESRPQFYKSS